MTDALPAALLGHVDDAGLDRVGGGLRMTIDLAVERDRAARGPGDAEHRLHDLAAAGADQAVEAEDLALAQLEADVVEFGRVATAGDVEHRRADRGVALGEDLVDGAADHHA